MKFRGSARRIAGVVSIIASALSVGVISLGVVDSAAEPAAPASAVTKSQQLISANPIKAGAESAVIRSLGGAREVQQELEADIPQAPRTQHTIASIGWDKAVGLARNDVAFVAQFRAACGWWERAYDGSTDVTTTRILGQLEDWNALRGGPYLADGETLIEVISRDLTAAKGTAERTEAERLYTVNCISPRVQP